MGEIKRVVIVGAGQAGGETAQRLRQARFAGDIILIGEEPSAPYQRPPLSKAYLKGELSMDRLLLRPVELYAEENVALLTGTRVEEIDRGGRQVRIEGGRTMPYDVLVLATGAAPRALPLPGANLDGVFLFRTAADADALRPRMKAGAKLVVIGAGYIGLEAAAVARQLGLDVTIIETAVRPLARVTCPEVSAFFLGEHTRQGVRFLLESRPVAIMGAEHVTGVVLSNGDELLADIVIIGIGVTPETRLAQQCGLTIENGIVTDAWCRTSDPRIFAIGDCAARPMAHFERRVARLESVHNAVEGARIVASVITAGKPHAVEAPWFWSDQYDLKLQIAGLFQGYDQVVVRGAVADRSFAAFYYRDDRLIAADAVNRPAEYVGAKMMIQTGRTIPPQMIVEQSRSMKELAAAAR